jgi:hypothetical protein
MLLLLSLLIALLVESYRNFVYWVLTCYLKCIRLIRVCCISVCLRMIFTVSWVFEDLRNFRSDSRLFLEWRCQETHLAMLLLAMHYASTLQVDIVRRNVGLWCDSRSMTSYWFSYIMISIIERRLVSSLILFSEDLILQESNILSLTCPIIFTLCLSCIS